MCVCVVLFFFAAISTTYGFKSIFQIALSPRKMLNFDTFYNILQCSIAILQIRKRVEQNELYLDYITFFGITGPSRASVDHLLNSLNLKIPSLF